MLESWFEDSEDVRNLVAGRGSKPKRKAALIAGPLQQRRRSWAQLAAWTAFVMKHESSGSQWQDFAIVGRELLGARPLSEIPFMHIIAEATMAVQRSS